jgi:hypothetical protein
MPLYLPVWSFPLDADIYLTAFNGFNIFTDLVVLVLPFPMVWSLDKPIAKRLSVLALFAVGSVPLVAGCLRLKSLVDFRNAAAQATIPWHAASQVAIWGCIEVDLGIICASVSLSVAAYDRHALTLYTQVPSASDVQTNGRGSS